MSQSMTRAAALQAKLEAADARPSAKRLAKKWETMPKGWTDESRKEFWDDLVGDVKHKVTKCMDKMKGKVDNTGAFCGALADRVEPGWRERANKDKKACGPGGCNCGGQCDCGGGSPLQVQPDYGISEEDMSGGAEGSSCGCSASRVAERFAQLGG